MAQCRFTQNLLDQPLQPSLHPKSNFNEHKATTLSHANLQVHLSAEDRHDEGIQQYQYGVS